MFSAYLFNVIGVEITSPWSAHGALIGTSTGAWSFAILSLRISHASSSSPLFSGVLLPSEKAVIAFKLFAFKA